MQKSSYLISLSNLKSALLIDSFTDEKGLTIIFDHASSVSEIHIPILQRLRPRCDNNSLKNIFLKEYFILEIYVHPSKKLKPISKIKTQILNR